MEQLSATALVELLARHQLLDAERLAESQECAMRFSEGRELAQQLMRRGWLTAYQANQLFLGRAEDLVVGQFVLLDRLGEGGMGQVFKAWQRNLQRVVALKLIRKECLNNPRMVRRFQREIRAAGQLAHPHIVHAYDAGQEKDGYFIAMEYIEGQDLARMVHQSGPLAVPQACDFLRQGALGLQHAYEHGLVHRDIKPANLLWTSGKGPASGLLRRPVIPASGLHPRPRSGLLPRVGTFPWGIVKILDLGLARWIGPEDGGDAVQVTQLGSFLGTPDFMAPEQALNSQACDIRSDVYSLGCTLYFLLAGEPPFPGGSIAEKIGRHQKEEPEPVEAVRHRNLTSAADVKWTSPLDRSQAETPVSVACLVRRLMAKDPAERVQTPGELAEILEEIQNNPGRASIPPAASCRPKPKPRQRADDITASSIATPRSALESSATIVTLDEPLESPSPEILPRQDRPARKRRWTLLSRWFRSAAP